MTTNRKKSSAEKLRERNSERNIKQSQLRNEKKKQKYPRKKCASLQINASAFTFCAVTNWTSMNLVRIAHTIK